MPTNGVIEIDGQIYCIDLEKMLNDSNCPKKYLLAIKKWLDEHKDKLAGVK